MLRDERYGTTRFWALYDGHDLVVGDVYKKGAGRCCGASRPSRRRPRAAAQAAAVEAAGTAGPGAGRAGPALAQQAQAAAQAVRARTQPRG